jgi:hypothetical protein
MQQKDISIYIMHSNEAAWSNHVEHPGHVQDERSTESLFLIASKAFPRRRPSLFLSRQLQHKYKDRCNILFVRPLRLKKDSTQVDPTHSTHCNDRGI